MDANEKAEFEKLLGKLARAGNGVMGVVAELSAHTGAETDEKLEAACYYISNIRSDIQTAINLIRDYMKR